MGGDSALDSGEILSYLSRNKTIGTRALKMRQLCLDALVEEGDLDFDWRLSFPEFSHILAPEYIPSRAICRLGGKSFDDGAETRTGCNGCVCACGKWVCTSDKCSSGGKIGENIREGGDGAEGGEGGGAEGRGGGDEAAVEEIRGKGREKAEGGKREIERKWWGKYGGETIDENMKEGGAADEVRGNSREKWLVGKYGGKYVGKNSGGKIGENIRGGGEEGETGRRIGKYNENYKKEDKTEIDVEHTTTEKEREINIEYDTKEVDDQLKVEAYEDEEDPEDDPDVQDIRWF